MNRWYVVSTKPRQEKVAFAGLKQQGFQAWLPTFKRTRRHARRVDTVLSPLFPGYLFVQFDSQNEPWGSINGTYGVARLLCQQGSPTAVPDAFIHSLQKTISDEGCVVLKEAGLKPGQKLRLTAGPFENCIGTLSHLPGKDRVAVLLSVFNKQVSTTVPREFVLPA